MCSSWLQHPGKKLLYNIIYNIYNTTSSHHHALRPGTGCNAQGAGQHCPVPFDTHSHSPVFPNPLSCVPRHRGRDLRRSGMQQEGWRLQSTPG